jgi:glutamine cyclotransferase
MALLLTASAAHAQAPVYGYEIVNTYPHDASAFTEGLVYTGAALYESTGLYGASTLRQTDLRTGAVLKSLPLAPQYFGEGATIFQGRIFQLTFQSQMAFVYNAGTFAPLGQFFYAGEGWGLTHDNSRLIMSDGTNQIRFIDPTTFQTTSTISVHDTQGAPVVNINELEYINGEIFANIWLTNWVARIDPASGLVIGWIDFTGLLPAGTPADVLNGIAFDNVTGHLLVTGKFWPSLFEVRVTGGAATSADGTTIPSASRIVDTTGAVWTIGGSGVILRDGVHAAGGYGSTVLWKNSTIYVFGTDSTWWKWTGSGWINVGAATPGGAINPPPSSSPDGTSVPDAPQIVDNDGAVWSIGSDARILRNGIHAAYGYGSRILWAKGSINVLGTDGNWWLWTGSGWTNVGATTPGGTPSLSSSPDGTTVPGATQIVDFESKVWTIGAGGIILRDGVHAAGGYGSAMVWSNGAIYVFGIDGNWWRWTGSGWLQA